MAAGSTPTDSTNSATTCWCATTPPANWSAATACCRHRAPSPQGPLPATEFDVGALDALRPSLVEMGRAVVRPDHRNGAVVLLMWAELAYLDRCGYDYVAGCVSVPTHPKAARRVSCSGSLRRGSSPSRAAPPELTVHPYRPVVVDGRYLDDIEPPDLPAHSLLPPAHAWLPATGRPGMRRAGP